MQSALKPRCIGCSNCVLACPFGVPKYMAEFDQMMKCDMCTDRTSEGSSPMCASVCPSEALWYGTLEQFDDTRRGSLLRDFLFGRQYVRTKVYTVVDDLAGGPLDVLAGTHRSWLDDPFGLERPTMTRMTDRDPPTSRCRHRGSATSPTKRPARKRSPGASSPATSSSAPARWPPATSASPRGPSCAPSTPANRDRSSPLDEVAVGDTYLFRYPADDDPAILLRLADARGRRVQPEVHPPRLRRLLPGRARTAGTARVTRATSTARTGAVHLRAADPPARPHRRRDPRRRQIWALGASREDIERRHGARPPRCASTSSSSSRSRCSSSPSPSRRSRPTTSRSPGPPPPSRSSARRRLRPFLRYLRP